MERYIVRQAIKDMDNIILGYEILFEKDEAYADEEGRAAVDAMVDFLEHAGTNIFENKIAFITFAPGMLFKSIPKIFDESKIVIQIDDSVLIHPAAYEILTKYKEQNYKIAINDFQFAPRYFAILGAADYIKLNFNNIEEAKLSYENILKTAKGFKKKSVACGVDTKEAYELALKMGADYFEGTYLESRITEKVKKVDYINSNFFMLVLAITKAVPDLKEVEAIISRDVALTYSIFKLVNSAYYATKSKPTTIMQAIVILGISGLKQWIYLLSFRQGEEDLSEDIVKRSFIRGSFCEALYAYAKIAEVTDSEVYLMGLFSTLGVMLGAPLEEVLGEINIAAPIKEALISNTGPCGDLFNLVISYEKADWKQITEYANKLGVPKDKIAQIYFQCIEMVNATWSAFRSL